MQFLYCYIEDVQFRIRALVYFFVNVCACVVCVVSMRVCVLNESVCECMCVCYGLRAYTYA